MYLLFAIKPDSADYCKGCHFDFVIFRNGIQVYDSVDKGGWHWDGEDRWLHESDEYWENQELNDKERGEAYEELETIMDEAEALALTKFEELKKKEEQSKLEKKLKAEETAKESRRKEFERLKSEFS